MCICDNWHVLYILVDCWWAWMEWNAFLRHATHTNCHIYTLLSPDDGLLASPKDVATDKAEPNSQFRRKYILRT
jgi:hypothetical protein